MSNIRAFTIVTVMAMALVTVVGMMSVRHGASPVTSAGIPQLFHGVAYNDIIELPGGEVLVVNWVDNGWVSFYHSVGRADQKGLNDPLFDKAVVHYNGGPGYKELAEKFLAQR